MLYRKWFTVLSLFVIAALLLSACQPIQRPPEAPAMAQKEILVQGAPLRWPGSLAVRSDGTLVASDYFSRAIVRLDPATGEILERFGPEQGVDVPGNVTVGLDDSLYWTTWTSRDLCRFTGDGVRKCQPIDDGVGPIGFNKEGRLFAGANDKLYEVDPNLEAPPALVTSIAGSIAPFAFGPDGKLYIPDSANEIVVRVDINGKPATAETIASNLPWLYAVGFDAKGQLYAVISYDENADGVVQVDPETGTTTEGWRAPPGLAQPALTQAGQLYISDIHGGALYELLEDGGLRTVSPAGMIAPGGLAVLLRSDGGESLFEADTLTLREFDGATGTQRDEHHINPQPEQVVAPVTVAADGDNLLITSPWFDAVQLYNPATHKQIEIWQGQFDGPVNAIRFQEDLVVAESGSGRVVRMNPDDPTNLEVLADGLDAPAGLAASEKDLWVSDYATGKVFQIVANGEKLTPMKLVASGLKQPEGLAVAPDGRLLVAETGADRLLAIDLQTGEPFTLATNLGFTTNNPASAPPYAYWIFNGVAVGPSGNIYVAGDAENVIYRIPTSTTAAASASSLDDATAAKIDAMVEETMARINLPGFALAVVKDGEVAYAKGFGVTSLDGGAPVTDQTVFQWAETSMALTAMAVMQLVEAGKLDLEAPVTDHVPYFKLADERYKEITVGQLLAHTSGIPDSGDAMADWENFLPEYDGGALERWVRNDLAAKGLLFAPGDGWEYSDLAYALLGAVIGAASGQPYEEYMQEQILTPLGMDKSTFLLEEVDKALLASPHVPNAEGEVVVSKALPYHRPFAATNNLFASVEDMARLAQANLSRGALGDQRILPESAYETMWTATSPTPFADYPFGRVHPASMMIDWGNGWFIGDIAGHRAPNTFGGEHGYSAQTVLVPDANLAVVAVGNSKAMDEFYASDIATDVAAMLLEEGKAQ